MDYGRKIVSSKEVEARQFSSFDPDDEEPLWQTCCWARNFLCQPHPELGRDGPVCPWVETSMNKGLFLLTICRAPLSDSSAVTDTLMQFRDLFLALKPSEGKDALFKTMLILFPDISKMDAPLLIDQVQRQMKGAFVAEGLMLGEFHQHTMQTGLHSPTFHPLRSPIPMLVIRHMVVWDLPFLVNDAEHLTSYIRYFGAEIPAKLWGNVAAAAQHHGIFFPDST